MASTPSNQGSLRQRNVAGKKTPGSGSASEPDDISKVKVKAKAGHSELEYKVTMVIVTALAFLTRFWGIGHPNEVVFDEVHFGKV